MTAATEKLPRVFRYNSVELEDPGPEQDPVEVRNTYTAIYPEITSAAIEGPEIKDGKRVYTFRKAVGTKGRVEIKWRAGAHVLGDYGHPKLLVWYRSRKYPGGDIMQFSLWALLCRILGHRWTEWQRRKYISGHARNCMRCGRWESNDGEKY